MRWLAAIALAAAAAWSFARTVDPNAESRDLDFGAIYRGAQAVSRGETPYVVDRFGPLGSYIYSPAWAYLLKPLASFEYVGARRIWMAINWLLAAGCVAMSLRLTFGRATVTALGLWLTVLPVASYYWSTLRAGQIGLLMAALFLGWAYCRRMGWRFTGGALLAASVAVKLAPAILVPYLLIRRDWRGLAGVAAGGMALVLLPTWWVGLDNAVRLHFEWAAHCRNTQVAVQALRPENQALLGQLTRLPHISNGYVLYDAAAFDAMNHAYPMVVLAIATMAHAAIAMRRRRPTFLSSEQMENRDIAVLILAMLLLHPRAWTYNFVGLVLPCAMLAHRALIPSQRRWVAFAALAVLAGVCAIPKPAAVADWSLLRWLIQGKDFWAALLATAISVLPSCRAARAGSRPEFAQAA